MKSSPDSAPAVLLELVQRLVVALVDRPELVRITSTSGESSVILEIVATPPSLTLVANFSSESTRGRYMGIFGLFNSFGWSIGPMVGGALLDVSYGRPMLLWGTITGIAMLAALGYLDVRRRIDLATDRNTEVLDARAAVA